MSLFITLFICIALLAIMDYYSHHNFGLFISTIILAVTAGIRYFTGNDYISYYWYYITGQGGFERGFKFLNNFGHFLCLDVFQFQIFYAFLTIGLLAYFLYKNVAPGIGGFAILYYFSRFYWARDLGQIRASLAAVVCLYSIKYIREKRLIPFLIIVAIAGSIHNGAFIFIAAYIFANFCNQKISLNKTILYIILAYVVGIFLKLNPEIIQKLTNNSSYVTSDTYTLNSSGSALTLVVQILVILAFVLINNHNKKDDFMDTVFNVYFTGTLIALVLIGYKTLGYRLDTILNTTEIIMIPYLINKYLKNKCLIVLLNIIACVLVFYMIIIHTKTYAFFTPFNTMFSSIK